MHFKEEILAECVVLWFINADFVLLGSPRLSVPQKYLWIPCIGGILAQWINNHNFRTVDYFVAELTTKDLKPYFLEICVFEIILLGQNLFSLIHEVKDIGNSPIWYLRSRFCSDSLPTNYDNTSFRFNPIMHGWIEICPLTPLSHFVICSEM